MKLNKQVVIQLNLIEFNGKEDGVDKLSTVTAEKCQRWRSNLPAFLYK